MNRVHCAFETFFKKNLIAHYGLVIAPKTPSVMAVVCKALQGAMNIEATGLGIVEFLESER